MTTVAILPIFDADGEKTYRAIAGDKHSVGKTAGQALDALTTQLGETEFSADEQCFSSGSSTIMDSLGFVSVVVQHSNNTSRIALSAMNKNRP